jgi:hypothetical protein
MQKIENTLEMDSEASNPCGIQLDGPMHKVAAPGACEMKPMGFPQDARWYWNGLDG